MTALARQPSPPRPALIRLRKLRQALGNISGGGGAITLTLAEGFQPTGIRAELAA